MSTLINRITLTLILLLSANISFAQYPQPFYPAQQYQPQSRWVGIQSSQMDFVAASQQNSQWCWAASIQMVLNYYGVRINQSQIVGRTYGTDPYGRLPNWAGSFQAITANLNNWNVDNAGRGYAVGAQVFGGAPTPTVLLHELSNGRPVIVGYSTGQNSGHAVVITAANYSQINGMPVINSLAVRDPWPSPQNIANRGRVVYPGSYLASRMQAYWYIRVR